MGAMNDTDDMTLLRTWVRERSETAFRAVVERYAGLVFGVTLRRTGERPLAEEAVQNVFTDLARKATVILELQRPLAAWLHRCAVYESATLLRSEIRHRDKMKRFASTLSDELAPDPWQEVRPLLDAAVNALSEPDRRVLLLHWFERCTYSDIAAQTGSTSAAVQRRGLRALDKLAALLRRRGAVIPAAALAAGLTPQLTHAAPVGLAASVSSAAAHAAPAGGALASFLQQSLHAMASAKLTTAGIVLVSAAIPVSVQFAASHSSYGTHGGYATDGTKLTTPATTGTVMKSAAVPDNSRPTALDMAALRRALERVRDNKGETTELRALTRLMFTLTIDGIPSVVALLREVAKPGYHFEEVEPACYARWAELEPAKAVAASFALPGNVGSPMLYAAFQTWAAQDFQQAWVWLEANLSEKDWEIAGKDPVKDLAARDPAAAVALCGKCRPDIRKPVALAVASAWGAKDPEAALSWAQTMPEECDPIKLAAVVLEWAGNDNPARALALLEKLENESTRAETGWNILGPWAMRAPDEAFAEMMKNGGAWPGRLAHELGSAMAGQDAARAAEAARSMPPGPKRDEFVQGVLIGVAYTDPGAAVGVMELISDKELTSHGGLNTFIGAWARKDAPAAARWIASLPDDASHNKESAASHFQTEAGRSWQEVLKEGGVK